MEKLIITCAVTGGRFTRELNPYIPITPTEIIDSALDSYQAGASIIHLHVRDPKTGLGIQDVDLFREVSEGIKARCNVIQCLTTSDLFHGIDLDVSRRTAPLILKPELASVDCGSINFGDSPYLSPESFIENELKEMKEKEVKPELEIFEMGMIETCRRMIDKGIIRPPYYCGLILGTPSGAPANLRVLMTLLDLLPDGSIWFADGVGEHSLSVTVMAILLGGHARVGMEDTIYYSNGILVKSNADLVRRIVRIARELGREIATPDEARKILGLIP
jgi:3-keto-5-aminohexanoate cleavage enzyme